jgi:hypothetical protein
MACEFVISTTTGNIVGSVRGGAALTDVLDRVAQILEIPQADAARVAEANSIFVYKKR